MNSDGVPFSQVLRGRTVPDVLLIYYGRNDLGLVKSIDLISEMKQGLCHLPQQYPKMRIIFSVITDHPLWRYADPKKIKGSWVWVSNVMASFVLGISAKSIARHPDTVLQQP